MPTGMNDDVIFLDNNLSQFVSSFPNEVSKNIIDDQANLFVT